MRAHSPLRPLLHAIVLAAGAASTACAPAPTHEREAAGPATVRSASIACPALRSADVASLFGVDATTAAHVDQIVKLGGELAETAKSLDEQVRTVCATIAKDLDPAPLAAGADSCAAAKDRFVAFAKKLPAGAKLAISARGVSCAVPRRALEQCAGECLTGKNDVTSAVRCDAETCGLDASFPNASAGCAARCSARALALSSCTADVDVRVEGLEGGEGSPNVAPTLDALRRDLPKLVALAGELAPKVARSSKQAASLVDELASAIDGITSSGDKSDRRVVSASALALCVAPELAQTVRAGAKLEGSLQGAVALHQALVGR
jgi:hypothetical protein